jgi:uncharacterized protein (DUF1330 family)
MAKAYWISAYRSISDSEKVAAYGKLAGPAIEAQGGRFLARGGRMEVREAGLAQRTVIVEFPSLEAAVAAYESPAYQEALAVFDGAAERDLRIVEGLE